MEKSFTENLTIEVARLFMPLERLDDKKRITAFIHELGWQFEGEIDLDLSESVQLVRIIADTILELVESDNEEDALETVLKLAPQIKALVEKITELIPEIETAIKNIPNVNGESADIAAKLSRRIFDYLIYIYLQRYHRQIFSIFHMLCIAEIVNDASEMPIKTIQWERIPQWFFQPLNVVNDDTVYKWSSNFDGNKFLTRLELLMKAFLWPGGLFRQNKNIKQAFERVEGDNLEMRIPLHKEGKWLDDSYAELGISLSAIQQNADRKGLAILPYLFGTSDLDLDLSENWNLDFSSLFGLDSVFGIIIRPPAQLEIIDVSQGTPVDTDLKLTITRKEPSDERVVIFGSSSTTNVSFKEMAFSIQAIKKGDFDELIFEIDIKELSLVIQSGEGDGFIKKILLEAPIQLDFDLTLGISTKKGFYFKGGAGFEYKFGINKSLGTIFIHDVGIKLFAAGEVLQLALVTTGGLELGPIAATVQNIGLSSALVFNKPGVLGNADIDIGFKPPDGVGLSIDAAGITGGGVLEFDNANQRYTGDITLNFGEIGLTAIGLITTKMPDGSEGFALLINIGATFNPPMQLSMGFTLSGVGGLIGVNRSMEIDVLRTGLKNRTLDSILFPDPSTVIANASKIISDLRTVFPPAEERYVVGPMVKIGWGSPTIITADLGIFLEFPDPVRIVLLGQVEAALPEEKKALVVIHLDVLGVLEFAKEELTFQASLYDSRILSFTLFGDSAFLLGWGGDPRFALSLGGFHPKFSPPPPPIVFADLKRLTLDIGTGSKLQLACRAYLALTPNSLQFGARVDLYASAGGFTAEGHLGFDALFYLSPFSFEVEICGGVHLKYKGLSLCGINLTLLLSGPTPWHARGKAKISLLFFSINVGFSITWGQREKVTLSPIDAWQPLQEALAAAGNWSSGLPAGRTIVESLRGFEEEAPGMIIVHPAGRIEVRQNVVPLGICLDKVGNAPITGHDRFDIEDLIVDGESLNPEPVQEFFARGQFEELTSDQKLSVPSFERMKGGVTTAASETVRIDGGDDVVEYKPITYESILIKRDSTSELQQLDGVFEWAEAQFIVAAGITRKAIRRAGPRKRFSSLHPRPKVGVHEEAYCIANAEDQTRATLSSELDHENRNMTRMAADQALRAQIELEPKKADNLLVVPEYEVYEVMA